ncbi:AAA domain-containing protein [Gracilibacillus sp. YIM 98692]|uniref:AAA domain-containing protein n=1 Tax=Gracilibacillus sp. YIM 98692 TaxID=2663532 RepID=UPI0013D16D82|nr:AAA domain-containing protein [Gracilibacillus sp. YIM 98692]
METNFAIEKAKNFFEYLLELNNLVGKVTRDYREFEKNWHIEEFADLNGCYLYEDCHNEESIFEIHRPNITEKDKQPPRPPDLIKEWIDFNFLNENSKPSFIKEKLFINDEDEVTEYFLDSEERKSNYTGWISEWSKWSEFLKEKKQVLKIYEEFFELISRLEKEGESLEFILGSGLLCWQHPDAKVGSIRSPLLTSKLELDLNAEKGVISARLVDKTIKIEREIFTGVHLPNINQFYKLFRNLDSRDINEDLTDFYTQFIHLLDANGKFVDEPKTIKTNEDPIIYNFSLFSLRSKNVRVLREDLQQIISGISDGYLELTDTVSAIVGDEIKSKQRDENKLSENKTVVADNSLYFPLESNEQQKEIINRIERHHGVTVQGPPGTGKTHTIANLVSHFLSEGKKVLITSQKESPLKVLKNKIPKEIRDLCVPVLGGGRESLQEIEQSIRSIGEKLGELDVQNLQVEIQRNKEYLDKSKRTEAQLKNQLKDYAEKEGDELHYKGEKLYKYDVAKRLAESKIDYSWLHDDIDMKENFPLNETEFKELWKIRGELRVEYLPLKDQMLPDVDTHIKNKVSFSSFIENGNDLLQFNKIGQEVFLKYDLPKDENFLKSLLADIRGILGMAAILNNKSYDAIIEDCKAGGIREERWRNLLNDMESSKQKLFGLYNNLVTHKISLPDKYFSLVKEDLKIAKERLDSGKKPNLVFNLFKGKQAKYLFEDPVLNDKPLKSSEDVIPINEYIEYEELKNETARVFNGNMDEIGHSIIEETEKRFPHLLEERLYELKLITKAVDAIDALTEKLKPYKFNNVDYYSTDVNKQLIVEVENAIKHLEFENWNENFVNELQYLKELNSKENVHPILQDLIYAYEKKDTSEWGKLLNHLQNLHQAKEVVYRFYELLEKIAKLLPFTSKSIEMIVGEQVDLPEQHEDAFELRKLQTWLDETKDMNITLLKKQIEEEHKKQKRLIREIVSASTWKNQVERITNEEKRALSAWKTYIKRFGKGGGKYAHVHLQGAREEMKTAQSAIPVWIMPVNQVLENFPVANEKFDVIIFDESSQCDLFSINVLLRGKKTIVVGDDEQISPQAIGTNLEDVYELVRRHLKGIPNANLFDGNISLYEIAEQTFPKEGKLMLREHFRCVPEIIQFSNDLSYGGEMIPLRLPLEEEKIDPPVTAIKVQDGYNDEKDKDLNVAEVDSIVSDMVEMVDNPKYADQTFGVITLQGQKQHKLLETKIREKIGDKEFVNRKVICGNPYTLQGDERDIIFLSMVVAPNRNFRALTKPSEKQRFNVAASRAKNQMRLYHSVDLEELSSSDLRYRLLSYCKNPTRINEEIENLEEKCDSPFEIDVLRMILARGYRVTPQVEVGRYRIDLVIEGLRDRLAVECDGEKWHGPEKFEEDMQCQESLERAGWKFWRIRGREFYFDRIKAMESLWKELTNMGIDPVYSTSTLKNNNNTQRQTSTLKVAKMQEDKRKQSSLLSKDNDANIEKDNKCRTNVGVQSELFDSSMEEFHQQINLFEDIIDVENESSHQTTDNNSNDDSLYNFLVNKGLYVIDQREKGGSLWVIGGSELKPLMSELARKNIQFTFAQSGSRSTKRKPGWYSKYRG